MDNAREQHRSAVDYSEYHRLADILHEHMVARREPGRAICQCGETCAYPTHHADIIIAARYTGPDSKEGIAKLLNQHKTAGMDGIVPVCICGWYGTYPEHHAQVLLDNGYARH